MYYSTESVILFLKSQNLTKIVCYLIHLRWKNFGYFLALLFLKR